MKIFNANGTGELMVDLKSNFYNLSIRQAHNVISQTTGKRNITNRNIGKIGLITFPNLKFINLPKSVNQRKK